MGLLWTRSGAPPYDDPLAAATLTRAARRLAATEGVFGGFSSGANVAAALQLLRGEMAGRTIAVVICDSGLKYLSTDLWADL